MSGKLATIIGVASGMGQENPDTMMTETAQQSRGRSCLIRTEQALLVAQRQGDSADLLDAENDTVIITLNINVLMNTLCDVWPRMSQYKTGGG